MLDGEMAILSKPSKPNFSKRGRDLTGIHPLRSYSILMRTDRSALALSLLPLQVPSSASSPVRPSSFTVFVFAARDGFLFCRDRRNHAFNNVNVFCIGCCWLSVSRKLRTNTAVHFPRGTALNSVTCDWILGLVDFCHRPTLSRPLLNHPRPMMNGGRRRKEAMQCSLPSQACHVRTGEPMDERASERATNLLLLLIFSYLRHKEKEGEGDLRSKEKSE